MTEKKILKPFQIKLEALVPTTITYTINAADEHEAIKELERNATLRPISMPQQQLHRKIRLKATVYQGGTSMIKLSKNYRSL